MSKTIIPANYTPALNLYDTQRAIGTVSYTHLTLPMKRIVEISAGAVSLKKKKKNNH